MEKLDRSKLWGLEAYAMERPAFRLQVIAHKRHRRVRLNAHAALYFEDFLTMKYQVQEMLRVERIFRASRNRGGDRGLQPPHSGWQQLEGDLHDRVPGRRATAPCA